MQFSDRGAEFAGGSLEDQPVTADFADGDRRNAHYLRALDYFHRIKRLAGNDHA